MWYFNVTTFYFDKVRRCPAPVRVKDGDWQNQILFSLLIDKNKVPLGFQIFKGDMYEGHTFEKAIAKLKAKYNIKRIIVVADSGMLNEDNIALFDKGGTAQDFEYIVGDRLKSLSQAAIQYLTNIDNYTTVIIQDNKGKDIPLQYCTYKYKSRTIICTWSETGQRKTKPKERKK